MDIVQCCDLPELKDNRGGTKSTKIPSKTVHGCQNSPTETRDLLLSKAVSGEVIIGHC